MLDAGPRYNVEWVAEKLDSPSAGRNDRRLGPECERFMTALSECATDGAPQPRSQRQPSSGATYFRTLSMTCALYSTPSWFGTVSKSVSAAAIASSSASCETSTSGSAA